MAGWGIHHIDIAQWGNGTELTGPLEIEGSRSFPMTTRSATTRSVGTLRMKYANGVNLIFTGSGPGFAGMKHGITFEGPDGWVWVNRGGIDAKPRSVSRAPFGPGDVRLPVSTSHHGNFVQCVRTRQKTICNIDVAVSLRYRLPTGMVRLPASTQAALGPGKRAVRRRPGGQPEDDSVPAAPWRL